MKATLFVFSLFATLAALAHPGGLDKNGGHVDHKTGLYHYHRKTNAPAPSVAAPVVFPVVPVDALTNLIETETATVELQKSLEAAEPLPGLSKVPWWVYLVGLGCGYVIWEIAWYFCRKTKGGR